MKKIIFVVMVVVMIAFVGCATHYKLIPYRYSEHDMSEIYIEGRKYISLANESTGISLYATKTGKFINLHLFYFNFSVHTIDAIPEKIGAEGVFHPYGSIIEKCVSLKVYSAEEWLKRMARLQMASIVLSAIGDAAEEVSAGQSTTTTSGRIGDEYVHMQSTTYDNSKKQEVRQKNQEEMRKVTEDFARSYSAADKALLKRNTLFPGDCVEGTVMIKYLKADKYTISIPFGDENFIVEFKLSK